MNAIFKYPGSKLAQRRNRDAGSDRAKETGCDLDEFYTQETEADGDEPMSKYVPYQAESAAYARKLAKGKTALKRLQTARKQLLKKRQAAGELPLST